MRRLESLMLRTMTILLILGICMWSVSPVAAQTYRDPASSASGEPTDPERHRLGLGATWDGKQENPVRPASGSQSPVLTPDTFSYRLETFLDLLRRFGIFIPKVHRP